MKKLLLCLTQLMLFVCCNRQVVSEDLDKVDALLAEEKIDSAYQLLFDIKEQSLVSGEDRAHYFLLVTRASILTGNVSPADSCIDYAIDYYEQKKDNGRLADSYYYKGYIYLNRDSLSGAMLCFKIAEEKANLSHNLLQQRKIAEAISYVNGIDGNYNLDVYGNLFYFGKLGKHLLRRRRP